MLGEHLLFKLGGGGSKPLLPGRPVRRRSSGRSKRLRKNKLTTKNTENTKKTKTGQDYGIKKRLKTETKILKESCR